MSGLCLVLETMRQSLDSESESDNEEVEVDGTSPINSHPPSWHGSSHHLPTTSSTSESEAGNVSCEGYLCDQCGRARRRDRTRASGRPPLPSGRKRSLRPKKRAHFATDTDNSSDPEKLSDSLETPLFKPISGPSTTLSPSFLSPPLCSLSPREVKAMAFCNETRLSSSHSSAELGRGRQPFKANHELFKQNPDGFPSYHQVSKMSTSSSASPSSPSLTSHNQPSPTSPFHRHRFHLVRRNSLNIDDVTKKAQTDYVTQQKEGLHPWRSLRSESASRVCQNRQLEDEARRANKDFSVICRRKGGSDVTCQRHRKASADDDRTLPNYDEAIQRASLLRWAALQTYTKNSSDQQSSGKETTAAASDQVAREPGHVRRSVRRLEERVISHSSSSSTNHDKSVSLGGSVANHVETAKNSRLGPHSEDVSEREPKTDDKIGDFFLAQTEDSHESDDVFYSEQSNDNILNVSDSPRHLSDSPAPECRQVSLEERPADDRGGVASRYVSYLGDANKASSALKGRKRIILEVLV